MKNLKVPSFLGNYFIPIKNTPGVKKVTAKNLKKDMLKKICNQNGRPRPPAVYGIKIFDNNDQAAKQ